jgi:hypothetical protein
MQLNGDPTGAVARLVLDIDYESADSPPKVAAVWWNGWRMGAEEALLLLMTEDGKIKLKPRVRQQEIVRFVHPFVPESE